MTSYNLHMVIALLFSFMLAQAAPPAKTSAPAQPPKAAPAQPQPAAQAPAQPRTQPSAQPRTQKPAQPAPGSTGGIAITATDGKGSPFSGVAVELSGTGIPSRTQMTDSAGQTPFPSLRPGTYRLRFSGDTVVTFEREVTVRAKVIEQLPITLTPAEPPKVVAVAPPPPPPPPPPPTVGPAGSPQHGSLTNLADKQRDAKERREVLLSCSGNTRNMLVVLTSEQPQRVYEGAESTYYVISGEGAAIVGTLQSVIGAGSFISVPRATPFSFARQKNRPLVMLWTLSGEPCEVAK